ncbi:hypothetical protein JOF56_000846 [Kibdelosporangium banguiense]|uniref:Uncharacterized protein n=1 Tax=Kibdelosporangium banguiense TaxID=1365924 RepID=A0ABS4T7Q5_9PSEU|nr:hypothetical protein [Kibdelosporangium banguiense]MBP2320461.1 hypothetical protein [Kibdelosporangium banguiense]
MTSTTTDATAAKTATARPTDVDLTSLKPVWDALLAARAEEARAAQVAKNMRAIIEDWLGDNEYGTLDGRRVVSYKSSERIILSEKLVRERHPDVARECEDIIPIRSFRVLTP